MTDGPTRSPRALLDKYGLRAKKSWGQNFLGDAGGRSTTSPRLGGPARRATRVVELGAGLGHLTARLLARGAGGHAVERDRDMARVLRGELGDRATLLEADAARLDYGAVAGGRGAARGGGQPALPPHLRPSSSRSSTSSARGPRHLPAAARGGGAARGPARGRRTGGSSRCFLQREAEVSIERIVPPGRLLPAAHGRARRCCWR